MKAFEIWFTSNRVFSWTTLLWKGDVIFYHNEKHCWKHWRNCWVQLIQLTVIFSLFFLTFQLHSFLTISWISLYIFEVWIKISFTQVFLKVTEESIQHDPGKSLLLINEKISAQNQVLIILRILQNPIPFKINFKYFWNLLSLLAFLRILQNWILWLFCLFFAVASKDLIGEVTVTLPDASAAEENPVSRSSGDSGIELDKFSSSTATKQASPVARLPKDDSTLDLRKISRRTHKRSLSSDFFRDSKPTPVVTCVHRKNPCGRICGHRRALSSDFRIDKVATVEEVTKNSKKPIKSVLFGHRRNASNTSQSSYGKCFLIILCVLKIFCMLPFLLLKRLQNIFNHSLNDCGKVSLIYYLPSQSYLVVHVSSAN